MIMNEYINMDMYSINLVMNLLNVNENDNEYVK